MWNRVGYATEMLKQESTFHLLPPTAKLFTCWKYVDLLLHKQYMKSSIPSHGIDASKNLFRNGIDFSQGIDSVEALAWGSF